MIQIGNNEQSSAFYEIIKYYKKNETNGYEEILAMLREVQELYGYVPSQCQEQMCRDLNVKSSFITAIIKRIPSLKEQRARNTITVCTGPRCANKNSLWLLSTIEKIIGVKAGGVTEDSRFELLTQNCMHRCRSAANLRINQDEYGNVEETMLMEILENYQ